MRMLKLGKAPKHSCVCLNPLWKLQVPLKADEWWLFMRHRYRGLKPVVRDDVKFTIKNMSNEFFKVLLNVSISYTSCK